MGAHLLDHADFLIIFVDEHDHRSRRHRPLIHPLQIWSHVPTLILLKRYTTRDCPPEFCDGRRFAPSAAIGRIDCQRYCG